MRFQDFFTDMLHRDANSESRIKSFHYFLLKENIVDSVDTTFVLHSSILDTLNLPEDEVKMLKELHGAVIPFGLSYELTYIKKDGIAYPLSVRIVDANKDPMSSSQVLTFDEIGGVIKILQFALAHKSTATEAGGTTPFGELLAKLQTAELADLKTSDQSSDANNSQNEDNSDIERRIAELNIRAKKLLDGKVFGDGECYRHKRKSSYYVYDRSPKHLYGSQVFTKKNALDPNHKIECSRQWKFYLNEIGDLEAFIEHDEKILHKLKEQHGEKID